MHKFTEERRTFETIRCEYIYDAQDHDIFMTNINEISKEVESITFKETNMVMYQFFEQNYNCSDGHKHRFSFST
jgi:hypothetical protein